MTRKKSDAPSAREWIDALPADRRAKVEAGAEEIVSGTPSLRQMEMSASTDYDDSRLWLRNKSGSITLAKRDCVDLLNFLIEGSRFRDIRSESVELSAIAKRPRRQRL